MKRRTAGIRSFIARNRLARIVVATAVGWHQDRVSRLASSLSFYALLSLVPLLVTFHAVFSLVVDERTLTAGVDAQLTSMIGPAPAQAVREMLNHARAPSFASLQAIIGSVVTFVTAAGVFIELKDSMDAIW
ncbi:MAG TPA: YhjD/YihY/BrkB family envelope integrity protein, partial [Planctomycetota bacterium]|nr:YhjD/YihY/BrkB family envelope integrity protein [Planctomycetota bacterium]